MEDTPTVQSKTIENIAEDQIWIYENWERLCEMYPRKIIGVNRGVVVATAQSFGHLHLELKTLGYKPSHIALSYMDMDPVFIKQLITQRAEKIRALRSGDTSP